MCKHLKIKALILLVVLLYIVIIQVPSVHATWYATQAGAVRLVYNSVAPSVVKTAAASGKALLIGSRIAGVVGLAYILYDAGALTKISNWYDSVIVGSPAYNQIPGNYVAGGQGNHFHIFINGSVFGAIQKQGVTCPGWTDSNCAANYGDPAVYNNVGSTWAAAYQWASGSPLSVPTSPTDYSTSYLTGLSSDPGLSTGDLYGSPGAGAVLNSGIPGNIISSVFLEPSQVPAVKDMLGLTGINPQTGAQDKATANDNTFTQGDQQVTGLLGSILGVLQYIKDYTYNLVGIKTDTGNISSKMDNVAQGINMQTQAVQGMAGKLDNIAVAVNQQTQIDNAIYQRVDNVATGIQNLTNKLTETTATQNTLSQRLSSVKDLLLTKFPFSIVAAVTIPGAITGGTYTIPDLHMPLGTTIAVDPMQYEQLASWISWVRGLMSVAMWAIFILVMVRRATEI